MFTEGKNSKMLEERRLYEPEKDARCTVGPYSGKGGGHIQSAERETERRGLACTYTPQGLEELSSLRKAEKWGASHRSRFQRRIDINNTGLELKEGASKKENQSKLLPSH